MANWTMDCIAPDMDRVDAVIDGVCDSGNDGLSEMCHYVLDNHGKRIRPGIMVLAYRALGGRDAGRIADLAA